MPTYFAFDNNLMVSILYNIKSNQIIIIENDAFLNITKNKTGKQLDKKTI